MKDARDMLRRIIVQEVQYIEAMSLSLKQDERTILRLQNKANCLQKEIEERKELIEEYRSYLKHGSDQPSAKIRLIPSAGQHLDTKSSAS
jgi:predicted RNase H-like nuclease (RuvC/YqgF family)